MKTLLVTGTVLNFQDAIDFCTEKLFTPLGGVASCQNILGFVMYSQIWVSHEESAYEDSLGIIHIMKGG